MWLHADMIRYHMMEKKHINTLFLFRCWRCCLPAKFWIGLVDLVLSTTSEIYLLQQPLRPKLEFPKGCNLPVFAGNSIGHHRTSYKLEPRSTSIFCVFGWSPRRFGVPNIFSHPQGATTIGSSQGGDRGIVSFTSHLHSISLWNCWNSWLVPHGLRSKFT